MQRETVVTNIVADLMQSRPPLSRLISLIPDNLWTQIAILFSFSNEEAEGPIGQ